MDPVFNLEESVGKTVGRRKPPADPLAVAGETKESMREWQNTFRIYIPRGVYRFNSHEEADEWMWEMITRGRKKADPGS